MPILAEQRGARPGSRIANGGLLLSGSPKPQASLVTVTKFHAKTLQSGISHDLPLMIKPAG